MKFPDKIKYLSLSTRISILFGLIIILAMGLFSTFSLIKQKEDSISSISNNTGQLSQTIEKILRVSMLKNRRDDISLAVNNIVGSEGIKSIRILNHQGDIKFSSQKSEINKNVSPKSTLCTSCHSPGNHKQIKDIQNFNHYRIDNKNNLIYYALPISNSPSCYNGICHATDQQPALHINKNSNNDLAAFSAHQASQRFLGFIEIEVSIQRVVSDLQKTRNQLLVLTFLFALIASVVTYFTIRYFIGKPVKNLVEGTLRVARGDFKNEIPPGKAELGLLSESFNKMQYQLLTTQTQLIESEKLASVGKLADEIANEINNPLTGIIIYSESLIDDKDKETYKKYDLETIRTEALKIRESIRNILSLTRKEKPDFNRIDISHVMTHAISVVEKFSNFQNIKIITGIPKKLPDISADPNLLEQVFLDLLLIFSELMPSGGILNISAVYKDDKKEIEIAFTNTGKAISQHIVQKVFSPVNSYNQESFAKTEISLTVCKDIIEMHKGKIIVNPNGNGNSIVIRLPI